MFWTLIGFVFLGWTAFLRIELVFCNLLVWTQIKVVNDVRDICNSVRIGGLTNLFVVCRTWLGLVNTLSNGRRFVLVVWNAAVCILGVHVRYLALLPGFAFTLVRVVNLTILRSLLFLLVFNQRLNVFGR